MIQTPSFYEKSIQAHSFLHLSRHSCDPSKFRVVDEALRDIHFTAIREKQLKKLMHEDKPLPTKENAENRPNRSTIPRPAEIGARPTAAMRHSSKYIVRQEQRVASIENFATAENSFDIDGPQKTQSGGNRIRSDDDEAGKIVNKVTCTINYQSPVELQNILKLQVSGAQAFSPRDNHTPSYECEHHSTFDVSVEDSQLRQLQELRKWRTDLMQKLPNSRGNASRAPAK